MESIPGTIRILVAEDSPTQADHLRLLLEKHGFAVTVTGNGHEALEAIRACPPLMVISDVEMPEMDGYQLCRAIRNDPATAGLPVVLLTHLSNSRDILCALECGADNFLTKPYNQEFLVARMWDILESLLRRNDTPEESTTVVFQGERVRIRSSEQRIFSFLVTTFEAAVTRNRELQEALRNLKQCEFELELARRERDEARQEAARLGGELQRFSQRTP